MKELIIPSKLNEGDTVAFISISGGRAGDEVQDTCWVKEDSKGSLM